MINIDELSPVLIFGGAGFVASHLLKLLNSQNIDVYATKLPSEEIHQKCRGVFDINILEPNSILDILRKINPKAIINLAAQSSVGLSWKNMNLTMDVNIKGTINILNAIKDYNPLIKVLIIGSSEEYGKIQTDNYKISELYPVNPTNPYAISKAAQTMISKLFFVNYGLNIVTMRPFNHIGPGQSTGFVVPDFCYQIAKIEKGLVPPVLSVGNLTAKRDFSDVRDIVRGYLYALKYAKGGEIYNIGSGKSVSIEEILFILLGLSSKSISVFQDPQKMRPSDMPIFEADISKFKADTNYSQQIPLKQSLLDTLNYFRQQTAEE